MANVNGNHNQVESREREDGRTRMAERVLPELGSVVEKRQAQFPTSAPPD